MDLSDIDRGEYWMIFRVFYVMNWNLGLLLSSVGREPIDLTSLLSLMIHRSD